MPKEQNITSLMESNLLNDETKTVLKEAWDTAIASKQNELELEYAEKLNENTSTIRQDAQKMIEEAVADELTDIADEIAEARTLDVRYAERLEEFKKEYDTKLQEQVDSLVESTVAKELEELKEGIEEARKQQFAMNVFEAYRNMFESTFGGENMNAQNELNEAKEELASLKRKNTLNELLENLTGDKRQVALTVLEGVATDKLESKFESIRPMLLAESEKSSDEKKPLLNESADDTLKGRRVVTENEAHEDEKSIKESKQNDKFYDALKRSIQFAHSK